MRKLNWLWVVLLVAGVAGLGIKLRADWRTFHATNDPANIKIRPLPAEAAPAIAPAPDYTVVAQQNPFHPERNDAMPPPPPAAQRVTGPPPLVYGSMMLGKDKFALMATDSDPKPRKVMEGSEFNGYKLAQVKEQSVVLESDGTKNEVMFYNALSRLRRDGQKTQASAQASAPATTTTVANGGGLAAGAAPAAAATQAASEAPQAPATPGAPNKKMIQTPFGPIWVDK